MPLSWQDVQSEALRRIQSRDWQPGAQIPNEADLAAELGCSRATVNRALRTLADAGWLERRRKAGTRVVIAPQRRASLAIPLIRQQIEARGQSFSHVIVDHDGGRMPPHLRAALGLSGTARVRRCCCLYLADARAFAFEDRWVNLDAVPGFATAPLDRMSPNEWLVQNAPFAHGTLDYSAAAAAAVEATQLNCPVGTPVMILERRTFGPRMAITHVRLTFAPGHHLRLEI